MYIKRQDGLTFGFHFNNIRRGAWVLELLSVDGERVDGVYSDSFGNERAARSYARDTVERWYRHERYGWCQK